MSDLEGLADFGDLVVGLDVLSFAQAQSIQPVLPDVESHLGSDLVIAAVHTGHVGVVQIDVRQNVGVGLGGLVALIEVAGHVIPVIVQIGEVAVVDGVQQGAGIIEGSALHDVVQVVGGQKDGEIFGPVLPGDQIVLNMHAGHGSHAGPSVHGAPALRRNQLRGIAGAPVGEDLVGGAEGKLIHIALGGITVRVQGVFPDCKIVRGGFFRRLWRGGAFFFVGRRLGRGSLCCRRFCCGCLGRGSLCCRRLGRGGLALIASAAGEETQKQEQRENEQTDALHEDYLPFRFLFWDSD